MRGRVSYHLTALAIALGVLSGVAHATTIDTTGIDSGDIYYFGSPDTATYGQTFTVPSSDTVLNSFSLYLINGDGNGTLDLRGYIGAWDGSKATNILYTSATRTINADTSLQELDFNTGALSLVSGQKYVAFLSISELGSQADELFQMPGSGQVYSGGDFVFYNNDTNFGPLTSHDWTCGEGCFGTDAWFKASFSSPSAVPEPSTLLLLGSGLAGLGGLVWRRHRRG